MKLEAWMTLKLEINISGICRGLDWSFFPTSVHNRTRQTIQVSRRRGGFASGDGAGLRFVFVQLCSWFPKPFHRIVPKTPKHLTKRPLCYNAALCLLIHSKSKFQPKIFHLWLVKETISSMFESLCQRREESAINY